MGSLWQGVKDLAFHIFGFENQRDGSAEDSQERAEKADAEGKPYSAKQHEWDTYQKLDEGGPEDEGADPTTEQMNDRRGDGNGGSKDGNSQGNDHSDRGSNDHRQGGGNDHGNDRGNDSGNSDSQGQGSGGGGGAEDYFSTQGMGYGPDPNANP